jgi:Tfp pilus assembly protein PilV
MSGPAQINDKTAGFSLLETIVAFAILALVLAATMQSISLSTQGLVRAGRHRAMDDLAALLMATAIDDQSIIEMQNGESEDGLRWHIRREAVPGSNVYSHVQPFRVTLTITDTANPKLRRVYSTHILGVAR